MSHKSNRLWQTTLGNDAYATSPDVQRLSSSFERFRDQAAIMAEEIPRHVPWLTDHGVRHMDSLWEMASILLGDTVVELNPLEGFVLGSAFLLHDLANAVVTFPNGVDDLKGPEWNDLIVSIYLRETGSRPSEAELINPPGYILRETILHRLRAVHAQQAHVLVNKGFRNASGDIIHLLDDRGLRDDLGHVIGQLAHSHHWPINKVESEFSQKILTSSEVSTAWEIDLFRLACILRCADAIHIDSRRAPTITIALRQPEGESEKHWIFQNRLYRPRIATNQNLVEFRSRRPFVSSERVSWWLCFETICWVNTELQGVDKALRAHFRPPLQASGVAGANHVPMFRQYIESDGWEPIDSKIKISNPKSLIKRFGGRELYGDDPTVPIRELIANAADAVRARSFIEDSFKAHIDGLITLTCWTDESGIWLEVNDNGIGMSEDVLTGPFLDFGTSYWSSQLARSEHPGLLSSPFRPTGKFGLGVFSIFMIASGCKVITRPLQRSLDATLVLEFESEKQRPYLRKPDLSNPKERVEAAGGTRVQLLLKPKEAIRLGIADSEEHLARLVQTIAPASDVSISTFNDGATKIVVHANDWTKIDYFELYRRITGNDPLENHALGQLRNIVDHEETIARFIIGPRRKGGIFTVGGMKAGASRNSFFGIIKAEDPRVARDEARPLVDAQLLCEHFRNNPIMPSEVISPEQGFMLAVLFNYLGLPIPLNIPMLRYGSSSITIEQATEIAATQPIVIVCDWKNRASKITPTPIFSKDYFVLRPRLKPSKFPFFELFLSIEDTDPQSIKKYQDQTVDTIIALLATMTSPVTAVDKDGIEYNGVKLEHTQQADMIQEQGEKLGTTLHGSCRQSK